MYSNPYEEEEKQTSFDRAFWKLGLGIMVLFMLAMVAVAWAI